MSEKYWYEKVFSDCYMYEVDFNIYKPGGLARIRVCRDSCDNKDSHVMVCWTQGSKPALDPNCYPVLTITDIQPIKHFFSKDIFDLQQLFNKLDREHNCLTSIVEMLSNRCITECSSLSDRLTEGAWVLCDISACCYVVLSTELANPAVLEGSNPPKECFDFLESNIQRLEDEIDSRERILGYNKHHLEYRRLIKRAYKLEAGIPERQYEGLALAWLLFNVERSETALRYFKNTGEIHESEELDVQNVRDARFLLLKEYTENFLEQASDYKDQGQIWAILHFTMFLLELAMCDESNTEVFNDFMGLYPVIGSENQKDESLYTISPIQYSPQFTFAFLCIPTEMRYCFGAIFCQLLHEFFHYIPTDTRLDRNELFLRMFGCAFLGEDRELGAVEALAGFLMYHYKRLGHDTLLFQDSMSFISIMRVVLNRVDISDYLKEHGFSVPSRKSCMNKQEQIDLLWGYTFFLREVRSDISMIKLLNMNLTDSIPFFGLRDYIRLMANEPKWATFSAKEVSVASILRFGYMTQWICENIERNPNLKSERVIHELSEECNDPVLKRKYVNLIQYLAEYEKEWEKINIFEKDIGDFAERWGQDKHLNRIKNNPFWKDVLGLLEMPDFDQSSYDLSKVQKDFLIKLLFLNLPYYKEYYLESEPNE